MQHANNDDFCICRHIINGVAAFEGHSQTGAEQFSLRSGQRKIQQAPSGVFDPGEQVCGDRLRSLDSDVGPYLGKIGFRRFGQAEGERAANSFLPRSMMRAASKSLTRPEATSANPASISALSAASS